MTNEQKNIPELRFPEFDGEWKLENLGDLADIVRGASPRPIKDSKWFDDNSDIGWLRISDVTQQNGKIKFLQQHLSTEGQKKTRVLYEPHLLLSIAASVGKPVINYVKTGVHDGFLIFMKPKFDLYFMFNWLENFQLKWNKYGQPGSQVNLNSNLVKSQNIYIPYSYEEEKKMGTFFSKLDRQIELEEKKLELLEQQKRGYMQKIFSQELRFKDENNNSYPEWKIKKLEEISEFQNGKAHENFVSDTGKFILVNSKFISTESKVKKYVDKQLTPLGINDIAIVMSDVPNGKALAKCYLIENDNTFTLNQRIGRIFNIEGNSRFLFTQINRNKQLLKYDSGVGQTNLKKSEIIGIKIHWPNKREQDKIGDFFINLDSIIEKQSTKVELLKQRKKGLLQKMFI
ncbi:restriction endonuclease subunit S [Staphylococcus hominis]|uniref:restriction endonuclease subunit S n=1 Tax=Staphylococcus hominis TaxID=1290 RepID=UPI00287AE9FA|nr:restriction endonuclease subunit S [Staphylococcus hominis]MDS3865946.1 restriction endonuclease subunit S [Staphylococcus hominis]